MSPIDVSDGAEHDASYETQEPGSTRVVFRGSEYTLTREIVESAARRMRNSAPQKYYVQLADESGETREVPIRQLVIRAIREGNPDKEGEFDATLFTSLRARDILERLGFNVKAKKQ